ncbi:unnamed protein product [Coregonus sp. 'balchen']|nr:unnamed protein product [Coregonus sp. 'balchen']
MGVLRILEIIFFFYFASHIPITLFIDLQALLPAQLYPQQLKDLLRWYGAEFRDPMMLDPPTWFKTPAIVYSTHVATTLVPILAHILYYPFPTEPHPGPQTQKERYTLAVIYAPYLLVPLMLLFTMLCIVFSAIRAWSCCCWASLCLATDFNRFLAPIAWEKEAVQQHVVHPDNKASVVPTEKCSKCTQWPS